MASRSTQLRAEQLIKQAAELMGWGVAYLEGGYLVGDEAFFKALSEDDDEG